MRTYRVVVRRRVVGVGAVHPCLVQEVPHRVPRVNLGSMPPCLRAKVGQLPPCRDKTKSGRQHQQLRSGHCDSSCIYTCCGR